MTARDLQITAAVLKSRGLPETADLAGLRNGDLMRQRNPWAARFIIALSLAIVLFSAVKVFAHTFAEVRAMPRHVEGFR